MIAEVGRDRTSRTIEPTASVPEYPMTQFGVDCRDLPSAAWFAFGPFIVYPGKRALMRDGQIVQIGDKALDLLLALIAEPGQILSKSDLAHQVWRRSFIEDGSLRVAVSALRKLLGQTAAGSDYVINVVGRGYMFSPTVTLERWPDAGLESQLRSQRTARVANGRLPPLLHPIVGRQYDIQRITDLLTRSRFITVVGPGGVGKTATAVSCAALCTATKGGSYFVDLAAIRDVALVPSGIITALGGEGSSEPSEFVAEHLACKRLLIVLDNAEHVAIAVAQMVEVILCGAPHVKVIVTSREPLRGAGEKVYRLEPLKAPKASCGLSATEAVKYGAVELFVDRVQANSCDFTLTDVLAPTVIKICQRLDGLALAIRLAAGRVQAFGVSGVAMLLENGFDLLSQNDRAAPNRHQTLESAFDWSYDLLSPSEQALLASMAIFSHEFSLEAVQRVASAPDDSAGQTLATISDLVAKSLVAFIDEQSEARYRLLETVRVFALARLEASGVRHHVAKRHANYVISQCEAYRAELMKGRDRQAVSTAGTTIDDARAALQWSMKEADWSLAKELINAAGPLFMQFGFAKEVHSWISYLLDVEIAASETTTFKDEPRPHISAFRTQGSRRDQTSHRRLRVGSITRR